MRYYDLADDMSTRQSNRWHVGDVRLPDGTEPRLAAGIRLDSLLPLRAQVHHIGHVLEFCHTTYGVPIATLDLAKEIELIAGSDVQCIPVIISGQSGRIVLNATRTIRCVKEDLSVFTKIAPDDTVRPDLAGHYRHISKLVLDKAAIPPDAHFFRVKDWEVCLIVSEAVKDAMERVGCYGAEFTELEMA